MVGGPDSAGVAELCGRPRLQVPLLSPLPPQPPRPATPTKSAVMIEPEFVRKLVEKLANRVADRLAIFGWVRDHVYDTVMKAAEEVYEGGARR
jgi:hypothetical protein